MTDFEFKSVEVKQASDKKRLLRLNHSNWLYVVSAQRNWNESTPEKLEESKRIYAELEQAVNDFCKKENITQYLELRDEAKEQGHRLDKEYIIGMNVLSSMEIGPKRGLIHANIGVQVSHRTTIKMNYEKIFKFFKDRNKSYVVKASFKRGANLQQIMNYITKDYHTK